ncbi:MAG: hypothetical protein F2563_05135 [Actinobacteria bacterium]|uniref:Unannotated protein n=1 Tax=freshwater metagenome TaxID=449393 RepID=A0A6J6F0S7_9ZZZZ|nr:hypothetical protein [Actinomycetota bacterium]
MKFETIKFLHRGGKDWDVYTTSFYNTETNGRVATIRFHNENFHVSYLTSTTILPSLELCFAYIAGVLLKD